MNPIALIDAPAAAGRAVLGALATDPVVPSRTAATASRPNRRSARRLAAADRRAHGRRQALKHPLHE
jgi:hypothetical protein